MPNSLSDLLRKSAKRYPENTAVRFRNEEISYREIDLLSNQVAFCLRNKGVQIEDCVGIYMDKSIDFIVSIFGILKAGGCYVSLDPMAPPQRQSYIINDCSLKYLIISSKKKFQLHHILATNHPLKYIFIIDANREEFKERYSGIKMIFKDNISGTKPNRLPQRTGGNNLAYLLYTSGSTGKPKGVMITHKASLAFINWAYEYFGIANDEKLSAVSSFCFDLSIFDIFVTIKAGATICIVPSGMCGFPQSLAEFIEREKVTTWYSVPSILIQLVLYGGLKKKGLSALRRILFAGETFPTKYLRTLMQLIPHARYYNLYGPTETNVCTFYPVKNMPEHESVLPIGKPCEGTKVFVVDETGNFVKNGEVGELYVSGPALMKGYWNGLQKTDKVLLNNFLPSHINQNVYRTGDLVKVNKDGYLEFHGRIDNMIKSRGYRIELGEIESVLYRHPAVKEAAAVAIPDDKIGNKIKVVIVLKDSYSIIEEEVRVFCSKRLPHYMIPEIIIFNNFIPKTSTGKVDRQKLKIEKE